MAGCVIEGGSNYTNLLEALRVLGMSSVVLLTRGKSEQAIASFDTVLRVHPADADAHHSPGLALAARGDILRGQSKLEQATRLKSDDVDSRNDLGMVVLARQGNMTAAMAQFEEALRTNPQFDEARDNLKRAQAALNQNKRN
jgi:tetratricopeptide (TPR) repeat protein